MDPAKTGLGKLMSARQNTRMKIQELRGLLIPNERDAEVRKHLIRLLEVDGDGNLTPVPFRFNKLGETRGIAVIEPAGGGKTTAITTVLRTMAVLAVNPETNRPRYLELQVPSPATLKSVGLAILEATGLTGVSERTRVWEIWNTVRYRLGLLGISVLWLDEAQDLVMAKSASETETTLRMIKSLMLGENAVIPILSGTQRLSEMTSFDPQVSRRFSMIVPRDLQRGTDEANLRGLITAYCDIPKLRVHISDDLPARLITASRHRFGRAVENIVNAIECSLEDGDEALTVDHFAEAWAMQEGCNPDDNVFLVDDWLSIPLDQGAQDYETARTKRQHKKLERV
jgi:hypothetical protein